MNKILIVTPTYNELANIENLFDAIFARHPNVHGLRDQKCQGTMQ